MKATLKKAVVTQKFEFQLYINGEPSSIYKIVTAETEEAARLMLPTADDWRQVKQI